MRQLMLLAGILALAACGTRGALTLPPGPAKPPLLGNPGQPAPAPRPAPAPATPAPADNSSKPAEAGR